MQDREHLSLSLPVNPHIYRIHTMRDVVLPFQVLPSGYKKTASALCLGGYFLLLNCPVLKSLTISFWFAGFTSSLFTGGGCLTGGCSNFGFGASLILLRLQMLDEF